MVMAHGAFPSQAFCKRQLFQIVEPSINNLELSLVVSEVLKMPVIGWAFCAVLVAIATPGGLGQIAAVLVLFLLAVPVSAVVLPILASVSAIGLDGRTTQTVSYASAIGLAVVVAGLLLFLLNRLQWSDGRRDALTNALVIIIGVPVCMGAAYYRAKGMF
jgi:hypothetical protein